METIPVDECWEAEKVGGWGGRGEERYTHTHKKKRTPNNRFESAVNREVNETSQSWPSIDYRMQVIDRRVTATLSRSDGRL